jgi:hypothetical protein
VNGSAHVQAVVDHLQAAGVIVGRGDKPAGGGWADVPGQSAFQTYAIVWRIGSLDVRSTTLTDQFDDEQPLMFVRTFGGTAAEADTLLDTVRTRMLTVPLTVPGRLLQRVWLENSQTTTRTDNTEVGLYEAGDFYRIRTSPDPDQS